MIDLLSLVNVVVTTKEIKKMTDEKCERCNNEMDSLSACHLRCPNCGVEYDCSDKGSTW